MIVGGGASAHPEREGAIIVMKAREVELFGSFGVRGSGMTTSPVPIFSQVTAKPVFVRATLILIARTGVFIMSSSSESSWDITGLRAWRNSRFHELNSRWTIRLPCRYSMLSVAPLTSPPLSSGSSAHLIPARTEAISVEHRWRHRNREHPHGMPQVVRLPNDDHLRAPGATAQANDRRVQRRAAREPRIHLGAEREEKGVVCRMGGVRAHRFVSRLRMSGIARI